MIEATRQISIETLRERLRAIRVIVETDKMQVTNSEKIGIIRELLGYESDKDY